ncbi:hypothetical protein AGOR_G00189760 [Albula goreensis]|uniref:Uncharacterized protein n=1 Tax=Albula goreensis TaxID=1534307 RepID=A0A8T3CXP6_9TELE|nr:hypothetical protein AGOR_G00189760 [Albula goreensis]
MEYLLGQRIEKHRRQRVYRLRTTYLSLSEEECQCKLRVSRQTVTDICHLLADDLEKTSYCPYTLPVAKRQPKHGREGISWQRSFSVYSLVCRLGGTMKWLSTEWCGGSRGTVRALDRVDRGDGVVGRGTCRRDEALSCLSWPSLITCDASEKLQQHVNAAQSSTHRHNSMPDSLPSLLELQ